MRPNFLCVELLQSVILSFCVLVNDRFINKVQLWIYKQSYVNNKQTKLITCASGHLWKLFQKNFDHVVYHRFPKDNDLCKDQLTMCKRDDIVNYNLAVSDLFSPKNYEDVMISTVVNKTIQNRNREQHSPALLVQSESQWSVTAQA